MAFLDSDILPPLTEAGEFLLKKALKRNFAKK